MWVLFQDKNVHGTKQTNYDFILIQGTKQEAIEKFKKHFGFHPLEIVCDICETHYSIEVEESMEQATGYVRNCKFIQESCMYIEEPREPFNENGEFEYVTLEEFLVLMNVLVLN